MGMMIHLIIFALSFVLSFIFSPIDGYEKEEKIHITIFSISLIAFLLSSIMFFVGNYKLSKQKWNYSDPYSTEYIVALNDSNLINGNAYMRRGYIEEKLYYQYMVKRTDGGFVANKVNADHTTLYYSIDNYRVEWLKKERHWLWFEEEEDYNKIYIPEGSITDEYSVDLK